MLSMKVISLLECIENKETYRWMNDIKATLVLLVGFHQITAQSRSSNPIMSPKIKMHTFVTVAQAPLT